MESKEDRSPAQDPVQDIANIANSVDQDSITNTLLLKYITLLSFYVEKLIIDSQTSLQLILGIKSKQYIDDNISKETLGTFSEVEYKELLSKAFDMMESEIVETREAVDNNYSLLKKYRDMINTINSVIEEKDSEIKCLSKAFNGSANAEEKEKALKIIDSMRNNK